MASTHTEKKRDHDEITPATEASSAEDLVETPSKVAKTAELADSVASAQSATLATSQMGENGSALGEVIPNKKSEKDGVRKGRTIISFGYLGEGYQGLQYNLTIKTIEPVILDAMLKAGALDPLHASLEELCWDRCARTDKGVSAACNYISLNIRCFPDLIDRINANLPPTIRMWHNQRVGKSFRAHIKADSRRYQYVVPTSLFRPWALPEDQAFVFDAAVREKVNELLSHFIGSHKFHHYTQSVTYKASEANRTILSFVCGEPYTVDGTEWVQLTVVGRSFLIYHIRKMVAQTICVFKDGRGGECIDATFADIPNPGIHIAPGEGLYLEECFFSIYNKNVEPPNEVIGIDSVKSQLIEFRDSVILPSIYKHERESQVFTKWISIIKDHPLQWDNILQEVKNALERAFAEAKTKGYASTRGIATAEEWNASRKSATPSPAPGKEESSFGSD